MITVIFCVAPVPVFSVVTHILVTSKDSRLISRESYKPHISTSLKLFSSNFKSESAIFCLKHFTLIRTYIIAQFVYIIGAK